MKDAKGFKTFGSVLFQPTIKKPQGLFKLGLTILVQLIPRACIIKLITAVIYGFHNKLVFVPGKPFQASLVFREKH
jgi:hypothetical protein